MDKIIFAIICFSLISVLFMAVMTYRSRKTEDTDFAQLYCITEKEAGEIKKELREKAVAYYNEPRMYIALSSGLRFSPVDGSIVTNVKTKVGGGLILEMNGDRYMYFDYFKEQYELIKKIDNSKTEIGE